MPLPGPPTAFIPFRDHRGQGAEVLPIPLKKTVRNRGPGITLKILPGFDDALLVAAQRAASRHHRTDTLLKRDGIVSHLLEKAAILTEKLLFIRKASVQKPAEASAQDLLHRSGADNMLVEGNPRRFDVAGTIHQILIIGLKFHNASP